MKFVQTKKAIILLCLVSLILLAVLSGCATPVSAPTPTPTSAAPATPQVPLRATLPFSFEKDSLRITVLRVVPAEEEHGLYVPQGYRQWRVEIRFENLLKEDWPPERLGDRCTGFSSLKLKTDSGNVYKPRFSGGLSICGTLRPESAVTFDEENIFEIRQDEVPDELWAYFEVQHESQLTYIFALSMVSTPTPTRVPVARVVIRDFKPTSTADLDAIYLQQVQVLLRNDGDLPSVVQKLVVASETNEVEASVYDARLDPKSEKSIAFNFRGAKIVRSIGLERIESTVRVLGYTGEKSQGIEQKLAEAKFSLLVPVARIGETISEYGDTHDLPLTLLWWRESSIAVHGPYFPSEYYTFTARPGMKFVILAFMFENKGIREQETPYLHAGEIGTGPKGCCYKVWEPPLGVHSEEYNPRKSTWDEVNTLVGDSGGFETLLPEQSVVGCVVFEIPQETTPIEASIVGLPVLIKF
jgi:hypothetical protein